MMASDLVDFPATDEVLTELACRLEAAFAVNPDPIACRKKGPLRAAASAMAAREHQIFFMVTPLLFTFHASDVHFTCPLQSQGVCSQSNGPIAI
jgi:hypothetical protein